MPSVPVHDSLRYLQNIFRLFFRVFKKNIVFWYRSQKEGAKKRMEILRRIREHAAAYGGRAAYEYKGESLSYEELDLYSDRLAAWLDDRFGPGKEPLVVYGHKALLMPVCFLACVKAGRAYCPVDLSVPQNRVRMIVELVDGPAVLAAEPGIEREEAGVPKEGAGGALITAGELAEIARSYPRRIEPERWVSPEDTFYIIFTSGSTGVPKGVQIPYGCLNRYLEWAVELGSTEQEKMGKVFLNQAPFSFDLSVMDLYICLACAGTLKPLDKRTQNDFSKLLERFRTSGAAVWVSTPSFADVCLADPNFGRELLPKLELFLFCGERLGNRTASRLLERFPGARVINTYGPTESTVCMTEVEITEELCKKEIPLPVGRVRKGSEVRIEKADKTPAADGERGEILILGDTVSSGYFKRPEQTARAFFEETTDRGVRRGYRTGDEGYLKDGMLYYCGRLDLQVKMHGYRIELGDIENNLMKLPGIRQAVVVPRVQDEKIRSLAAFISLGEGEREGEGGAAGDGCAENGMESAKVQRKASAERLSEKRESAQRAAGTVSLEKAPSEKGSLETVPLETVPSEIVLSETGALETGASKIGPSETEQSKIGPSEKAPETAPPAPRDDKARRTGGRLDRERTRQIQSSLREHLPDYMIPKKIIVLEQIPMTVNGKADRNYLKGLLA